MIVVLHWELLTYARKKFTGFGTLFNATDIESHRIWGRDSDFVKLSPNTLFGLNAALFRIDDSTVKGYYYYYYYYYYYRCSIFFLTTQCKDFYFQTKRRVRMFICSKLLKAIFAGLYKSEFSYTVPSSNVSFCWTLSYAVFYYFMILSCAMQDVYTYIQISLLLRQMLLLRHLYFLT
jgi:hypothetical protein